MADKENNGAQNIDGVLEQLKKSYSETQLNSDNVALDSEDSFENVSHDELQERLRSQFLNDGEKSSDSYDDDYSIDEDFLRDVYVDDEGMFKNKDLENNEENAYGFFEEIGEENKKNEIKEEFQKETQKAQEAPDSEILEEFQEEDFEEKYQEDEKEYQEDEEVSLYEGPQALQEEEYNEAVEEIYAQTQDKEIQESDNQGVQLNDVYFEDDEDYSLWNEEQTYAPITLDDIEDVDGDDSNSFEYAEDTRTPSEKSEDNYVNVFYRSNEYDPYDNMSFKERISENAPTVDSLEAELDDILQDDFNLEEFAEAESMPLMLEEDEIVSNTEDVASLHEEVANKEFFADTSEIDRSDIALLLEFGYEEEVLRNVPQEKIEGFSDDELIDDILQENKEEIDFDGEDDISEQNRTEILRKKINRQYDDYRKNRGGMLLRLIISTFLAVGLIVYEMFSLFDHDIGGIFNRDEYFFAYVLIGLQILILALLPAAKKTYESFKNVLSVGIDAYFLAGTSVAITIIYDLIVIFERKEIPPTFHFCAALVIVLAELSELMRFNSEIKNYEYYFAEYIFGEDVSEVEMYKYTLAKSEGRGSIAEKMYAGGLNDKTSIYFPQNVEAANGFFEANNVPSKRNRVTYGWIVASGVVSLIFAIAAGIIYEKAWLAAVAFLITFNLMMPIIAMIAEWLPFGILSAQNYAYGAAFASEGAVEGIEKCDMLVFNDLHIFEKCNAKSVNLAIYDSTSKATLLSCLNSVYSEIGGPLQSAFSSVKVQSLGKCKINRIAKSGVEAFVGSNYSVLIGDEQFMSRYGIFFPKAVLNKEADKIFTLCVSINNRATARIAVKYKINETFYNIVQKLAEDKIYCAVQTYDPMISAELIARVRPYKGVPVNVVHKSSSDYALEMHRHKSGTLYSVMGEELLVLARGSRLNLAVALSNAKKISKLRKILNICSGALISAGALTALMLVLSERLTNVSWLFVFVYWIISGAILAGMMFWKFPQKYRFIFNKK